MPDNEPEDMAVRSWPVLFLANYQHFLVIENAESVICAGRARQHNANVAYIDAAHPRPPLLVSGTGSAFACTNVNSAWSAASLS